MTVSIATRTVQYNGDGSTTSFSVPFLWFANADVAVSLYDTSTGTTTSWAESTNYTLVGAGLGSGTLTASVAPATGKRLIITRTTPQTQPADLVANDTFQAETYEGALDRLTLMVQELAADLAAAALGGSGSGAFTIENLGAGAGVYSGLSGTAHQFKSLTAGANITLTPSATEISIAAAAPGETNTASNLGAGSGVFASKSGVDLRFKSLVAGANITLTPTGNDITIAATSGVAGETNTISSTGATGNSLVQTTSKVGVDLRVRGLIAGSNVTITNSAGTDWTIAATGEANTVSSTGASGTTPVQSTSKVGVDLRMKGFAAGTGLSLTSSGTDLSYAINQAAALTWTAVETFDRVPTTASPSVVMKGNQVGDIVTGSALLASNYGAMVDMRRTVNMAAAGQSAPSAAAYGGNFLIYGQMYTSGTSGTFGAAPGGIRMVTHATHTKGGAGVVDSPTGAYFGIKNEGVNLGAFGMHVDAMHSGSGATHTTYAVSAELWKDVSGGTMTAYVGRSQAAQKVDFGFILAHTTGGAGWKRGIQFGTPTYSNGGIDEPAGGTATPFDIGIDLTWANFTYAAMQIKENDNIILSGQAQAQSAAPITSCQMRWASATGNFEIRNGVTAKFGVNMSNGIPWFYPTTNTSATSGAASALPATPDGYMRAFINGAERKIPYYNL